MTASVNRASLGGGVDFARFQRGFARWLRSPMDFTAGGRALLAAFAFGAGAALYVEIPREPALAAGLAVTAAAAWTAWSARRRGAQDAQILAATLVFFAAAGFLRADLRAAEVAEPVVAGERVYDVSGWVTRVDPGEHGRKRYWIRVASLDMDGAIPRTVRVSAVNAEARLGDAVKVRARLGAPPSAPVPGAYDFSRAAYFQRLGGVGYALSKLEPDAAAADGGIAQAVAGFRGRLSARLYEAGGGGASGAILAALVTGDRGAIPAHATDALRASGLAHILAISGLHMALLGGGSFFALSWLFAAIEPFARGRNPRQWAAGAALVVCTVYLVVSGSGVATQRAFVMAALVFTAILCARRALTLRGVAAAALIVLTLAPESAVTPGFQMSFAATAALVAVFEQLRRRREQAPPPGKGIAAGAWRFFKGLAVSSLVAGMATGPFAAYHFNRIAPAGFAANLVAMPVFSAVVMPSATIAGALAPLGLEEAPAKVASTGLDVVLAVASTTETASGGMAPAPAAPPLALLCVAGALALGAALGRGRRRAVGALALLALAAWKEGPRPQIWVGAGGSVVIADGTGVYARLERGDGYGADLFLRRLGREDEDPAALEQRLSCDAWGCGGAIDGVRVSVVSDPEAILEDCARADVVVARFRAADRVKRRCAGALLIDRGAGRLVFVDGGRARVAENHGARPWTRG